MSKSVKMGRKSKNLKFLSRKGAFSLIATYFQSLTLLVPLISILLFNFNLQAILISLLATIWMNFVAAFKTKKMLGFKVSKKALTKIGIYVLALSFIIFYQLYFFGSERIVLASSCPTTAYCPDAVSACLTDCLSTYVSGTTCYYDLDQYCCSISRSDPDTCGQKKWGGPGSCRYAGKCTLACSGVGTSCCPNPTTYRTNVQCLSTGCSYTDYERDSGQTYCQATATGCTSAVWFGGVYASGSGWRCCGDDGSSDNFATSASYPDTDPYVTCDICVGGTDQGWVHLCGNGFFSSSSSSCNAADKTTATSGYCFYGDITCLYNSQSNGAVSGLLYGNGYWTGTTCYYGDINCTDGSYSNGASGSTLCSAGNSQCCPNQGQRVEGVQCGDNVFNAGTAYDRDSSQARCTDGSSPGCSAKTWFTNLGTFTGSGSPCCGDDTTSDDFATYSGSLTTSTSVSCRRCLDGSDLGTSTLYGNGYWTGTTCYYGDITCSASSASHGASGSTLCSAGNSQCCPNQGQRVEGVQCGDNVFNPGTAYDRDSSQARCTDGSSSGCSAKTWLVSNSTPGGPCCGDDGTNDIFENASLKGSACFKGVSVVHDNITSNTSYIVYNGQFFFCKELGGPNSEYGFATNINPGTVIGSWKCAYGVWSQAVRVGMRGGRIIIIPEE